MSAEWFHPDVARLVRAGVTESVHAGAAVIAGPDGAVGWSIGDPGVVVYPRSALKPFQAAAALSLLTAGGERLATEELAMAAASHVGSLDHQARARAVLVAAGLGEDDLRCPPALPAETAALVAQRGEPRRLAHNCSGKHAAFLRAQVAAGEDPAAYLDPASPLQRAVRDEIARATGEEPGGPATDGCGAPAWRCSLGGLATGFARLAAGDGVLGAVRDAMRAHPDLVGGHDSPDTALMRADAHVVAKRGAEAVFAAGWTGPGGPMGLAVKVRDGSDRAATLVAGTLLAGLGAVVPPGLAGAHELEGDQGASRLVVADEIARGRP